MTTIYIHYIHPALQSRAYSGWYPSAQRPTGSKKASLKWIRYQDCEIPMVIFK